ncbi:MAG: BrnA antitoxin family protein [Treponema sp.]|nr:BrnA antitoxin family protein [Treponema sp.]
MKKNMTYTEAPMNISKAIAEGDIVTDFLPPPDKLVRKEEKVKITISLNSGSIDFFKTHAKKNHVKYQAMINEVLDKYVQKYQERKIV